MKINSSKLVIIQAFKIESHALYGLILGDIIAGN